SEHDQQPAGRGRPDPPSRARAVLALLGSGARHGRGGVRVGAAVWAWPAPGGKYPPGVRTARPQPAGPPVSAAVARVRSSGLDAGVALAGWLGLVALGRALVVPLNNSDPF